MNDNEELEKVIGELNQGLVDFVLGSLRAHGYTPKVKYDGNVYFIFCGHPHWVTEFTMPQTPGWQWGIWANGENMLGVEDVITGDNVIQVFCQHKTQIDKFKPTASDCCVEIDENDLSDVMKGNYKTEWVDEPWAMRKVVALADFVRMHPFLAYCGECDSFMPMYYHPTLRTMRGFWWHYKSEASKAIMRGAGKAFRAYASMLPCVESARVMEWAYPASELIIHLKHGADPSPIFPVVPQSMRVFGETFRCRVIDGGEEWDW